MRKAKTYRSKASRKQTFRMSTGRNRRTLNNFLTGQNLRVTEFQSSHTWQNTVPNINFTKSQRFFRRRDDNREMYDLPTTKTARGTGFGYGNKQLSSLSTRLRAKYNPAPDRYNITGFTKVDKIKRRGKTFGIQHSARKYMPNKRLPQQWVTKNQPGPHEYDWHNVKNKLKRNKSYTCRQRGIMFNDDLFVDKGYPSPDEYGIPAMHMVQRNSYGKIHQGIGLGKKQLMHNHSTKNFPGPGTYSIPSFCDKILKRYAALKGTMVYGPRTGVKPRKKKRRRRKVKHKRFVAESEGMREQAEFENQKLQSELKNLINQKQKNQGKKEASQDNYIKPSEGNDEQKNKETDDEQ